MTQPLDDARMSAYVADRLRDDYCWSGGRGWMRNDRGRRWESVPEPMVGEAIRAQLLAFLVAEATAGASTDRLAAITKLFSAHRIYAILRLTKGVLAVLDDQWDAHPDLLNCANGVINLRDGSLSPHDPALMFTKLCPTEYDSAATHSDWTEALKALPADVADFLRVRLGQAVTGHPPSDDVAVFWRGIGANGKSTIVIGILRAVGSDYAVLVSDRVLLAHAGDHPTEKMELWGARLAIIEELPELGHMNIARLKKISGPLMEGRYCGGNQVTWDVTHSTFVTTNHPPKVDESDHGTWRRMLMVLFPYRYRKAHEPLCGPTDRRGDPGLRDRIKHGADKQHQAVLAWLVKGAIESYRGLPEPPKEVRDATAEWRSSADLLSSFLADVTEFDVNSHVSSVDLFEQFSAWLKSHGHTPWSDQTFAARLSQHPEVLAHDVRKGRVSGRVGLSTSSQWFHANSKLGSQYMAWIGVRFL